MKLSFFGAAHEVTGSCTLLEVADKKILIDCGMEQGIDLYENSPLPIPAADIDFVLLTHAHIDHSGRIPKLVADGFKGPIYATLATQKLCGIMLPDSAHIQETEAEWRNRKAKRSGKELFVPLYTSEDAMKALKLFVPCSYETEYKLSEDISISFTDAGHLLGSASISVSFNENGDSKTIVFSGDLGNVDRPLINNPKQPQNADYIVIESTYGTRNHGNRPDYIAQLTRIIDETLSRGGNLVIPAFSVGRTQEMLYLIREIKENNLLPHLADFPVYVDSPLSVEATEIYSMGITEFFDEETIDLINRGINPIQFKGLITSVTSDESIAINMDKTPKVIISSSGMCEAGRIRHHLKHNLWRKDSTVLFVGYQSVNTLGRIITEGEKTVKIFGEEITVNAQIEQLEGISGHADSEHLLLWLEGFEKKPSKIFVNHGDDSTCDEFAQMITKRLNISAEAPYNAAVYDLATGNLLKAGNSVLKPRATVGKKPVSAALSRLIAAGKRLCAIIEKYEGSANKDIAKFAEQVIALCNKWDK